MESCKVYFWEIPLWNQTPKTCLKHFQTSTTKLEKKSQKKKKNLQKRFLHASCKQDMHKHTSYLRVF